MKENEEKFAAGKTDNPSAHKIKSAKPTDQEKVAAYMKSSNIR